MSDEEDAVVEVGEQVDAGYAAEGKADGADAEEDAGGGADSPVAEEEDAGGEEAQGKEAARQEEVKDGVEAELLV